MAGETSVEDFSRLELHLLPTQANHGKTLSICDEHCNEVARLRGTDPRTRAIGKLMCAVPAIASALRRCASECAECNYGEGPTGKNANGEPCECCGFIHRALETVNV